MACDNMWHRDGWKIDRPASCPECGGQGVTPPSAPAGEPSGDGVNSKGGDERLCAICGCTEGCHFVNYAHGPDCLGCNGPIEQRSHEFSPEIVEPEATTLTEIAAQRCKHGFDICLLCGHGTPSAHRAATEPSAPIIAPVGEPRWLRNAKRAEHEEAQAWHAILEARRRLRAEAARCMKMSHADNDAWAQAGDEIMAVSARLDAHMETFRRTLNTGGGE